MDCGFLVYCGVMFSCNGFGFKLMILVILSSSMGGYKFRFCVVCMLISSEKCCRVEVGMCCVGICCIRICKVLVVV